MDAAYLESLQSDIISHTFSRQIPPPKQDLLPLSPPSTDFSETYFTWKSILLCRLTLMRLERDMILARLSCIQDGESDTGYDDLLTRNSQDNSPMCMHYHGKERVVKVVDYTYYADGERGGEIARWVEGIGVRVMVGKWMREVGCEPTLPPSLSPFPLSFDLRPPQFPLSTRFRLSASFPSHPFLLLSLRLFSPITHFPATSFLKTPLSIGFFTQRSDKAIFHYTIIVDLSDSSSLSDNFSMNMLVITELYKWLCGFSQIGTPFSVEEPVSMSVSSNSGLKITGNLDVTREELTMDKDVTVNSSKERIVLQFRCTEDIYAPADSLLTWFFKAEQKRVQTETVLEVEIEGWQKAYKSKALSPEDVSRFFMELWKKQVRFRNVPWNCVYCRKDTGEMKMVPRFPRRDVQEEQVEYQEYWQFIMTSWLHLQHRKEQMRTLLPKFHPFTSIPQLRQFPCIPLSSFLYPTLDSSDLLIGKGGFGVVYHNKFGENKVVVKLPNPDRDYKSKKIIQEIQLMSELKHPNIVHFYGVTYYQERLGIILERCDLSLASYVRKNAQSQIDMKETLGWLVQIADALAYMHRKDMTHFDLKPSNIMMQRKQSKWVPKISDFGMTSSRTEDGKWGNPGFTMSYSSPEQLQGFNLGPHCDVWSFGMVAYYAICRKQPYEELLLGDKTVGDKNGRKRMFLKEQCVKTRKPLVPGEITERYPSLIYLLRQCWHSNPTCRPPMNTVLLKLKKVSENLQ